MLGTGGAVRQALEMIQGKCFLVLNGDSYCRDNLGELATLHQQRKATATMLLVPVPDCQRYGSVRVDANRRVTRFAEKCHVPAPGLINAGIYLFERRVMEQLPFGRNLSLERDVLPTLVGQGLYAISCSGPFMDIGIPETFRAASAFMQQELAAGHLLAGRGTAGAGYPQVSSAYRLAIGNPL